MNNTFDLNLYLKLKKELVEQRLAKLVESTGTSTRLRNALTYSLMAGGKRLRPVLCLAAEEIFNPDNLKKSLNCACAIEMIHTYSLIHDDLPAMDDDDLRRGNLTCHKKFDEATAILAGDALLTKAFEILSCQNISCEAIVKTMKIISTASGDMGMIAGQMKDILAESKPVSLEDLKSLHMEKTGALIRASLKSGAVIGGGSKDDILRLDEYGKLIGLAFQVTDDILNVSGDPEIMGKAAGSDALHNKSTYPALLGLKESVSYAENLIDRAINIVEFYEDKAAPLKAVARYILTRKK